MDRIFRSGLVVLLSLLISPVVAQTIIISEDFEGPGLPTSWSRSQNSPSVGWEFGTTSSLTSGYFGIPSRTRIAASNDDANDGQGGTANKADRDRLITPLLNFSTLLNARMGFYYYFTGEYGSQATIEISDDNGTTWTTLSTLAATNGEWAYKVIDLSVYAGQSGLKIAFRHNDTNNWASGFAIDDVKIYEPSSVDMVMVDVDLSGYLVRGFKPLTVNLRNDGLVATTSFDLSYSIDSGATWVTETKTGMNIFPGTTAQVTFDALLPLRESRDYQILVKVKNPNSNVDPVTNNDEGEGNVSVLLGKADKVALLEEFTGAWCQYCPEGTYIVEQLLDAHPNKMVATGCHTGDGMANSESETLNDVFASGWPSGMVDRFKFDDKAAVGFSRGGWEAKVLQRMDAVAVVGLSATNTYDSTTREIVVDVTANFLESTDQEYRLSVIVIEDSVTGTGSGYNQINAFDGVSGHPYNGAGNPIVGFNHRLVQRNIMGGTWGQSGSLPAPVVAGPQNTYQFTSTLSAGYDESKVKLIAVVQEYNSVTTKRSIANALQLELNGTNDHNARFVADVAVIDVVNPTCSGTNDGSAVVDGIGEAPFEYAWSNSYGASGTEFTNLASGAYTVTMTDANGISATTTFTLASPIAASATITDPTPGGNDATIDVLAPNAIEPVTYTWSNGETTQSITGLADGVYSVTITDLVGCTDVLRIAVGEVSVGIKNTTNNIAFNVYPNPTSGSVYINGKLEKAAEVTLEVYNAIGERVITEQLGHIATINANVDMSRFSNGIYFVRLTAGDRTSMSRVVLEK